MQLFNYFIIFPKLSSIFDLVWRVLSTLLSKLEKWPSRRKSLQPFWLLQLITPKPDLALLCPPHAPNLALKLLISPLLLNGEDMAWGINFMKLNWKRPKIKIIKDLTVLLLDPSTLKVRFLDSIPLDNSWITQLRFQFETFVKTFNTYF